MEFERADYGYRFRVFHAYAGTNGGLWYPIHMPAVAFGGGNGLGPAKDEDKLVFIHTPIDDENTLVWMVVYNPARELGRLGAGFSDTSPNPDNWVPDDYHIGTQWRQDRTAMRERKSFTGIGRDYRPYNVFLEDVAVCESMGPIYDRTKEHLCAADLAIMQSRRVYLDAIRAHMNGARAHGVDCDVSRISLADGPEHVPPMDPKKVA
jgi:hypothetical protein